MAGILGELRNPFKPNPAFDEPENNFIEMAISSGIEKGLGNIGNSILHAGQLKLQSFAESLPELAGIALVCFYVYIGYKTFFKHDNNDLAKIFPITMIYVVFKLFWKIVLHI